MPRAELSEFLRSGESPYFGMFRAGCLGYTAEEVSSHCAAYGIPLRPKDIQSWQDGWYKYEVNKALYQAARFNPGPTRLSREAMAARSRTIMATIKPDFDTAKLGDFPKLPDGWAGTNRRFFPCTADNRPMCQWGWRPGNKETGEPVTDPGLLPYVDAKALSPVGWVGQNMLYQPFIVLDIDGEGHGQRDEEVIRFGMKYIDRTMSYVSPKKPGSFHLYFKTDRLIPVKHFPHAKLDLMGNAVNAAVYMKDKICNNMPMADMSPEIWDDMMRYQAARKEKHYVS